MIRKLYQKYKEPILYIVFGGFTTLINIIVYYVFYDLIGLSNIVSNIIAWILSVLFAYVTNKIWVFRSLRCDLKTLVYEAGAFFSCRLATGALDLVIMYVGVDVMVLNAMLMKIMSNVIVIILNYMMSKIFVFK